MHLQLSIQQAIRLSAAKGNVSGLKVCLADQASHEWISAEIIGQIEKMTQ
jgi:hypothetical protein